MEGVATKTSKKAHLLKVMELKGTVPRDLEKWMDRPQNFMYLWEWLEELAYPMSYVELAAWQDQTGRRLSRWEVRAMSELDRVRSHG